MGFYLCKLCGTVTNTVPSSECKKSSNRKHSWLYGNSAGDYVHDYWETNPLASVGSAEGSNRRNAEA